MQTNTPNNPKSMPQQTNVQSGENSAIVTETAIPSSVQETCDAQKTGFHKVICPDGIVYLPIGINIDRIYGEKLGLDHPFSKVIASIICQKIIEGHSLVSICKLPGFPPYSAVDSWKRSKKEFKEMINDANKHRAEMDAETAMSVSKTGNKLRVETLRWSAGVNHPAKYRPSPNRKSKDKLPPADFIVDGGKKKEC